MSPPAATPSVTELAAALATPPPKRQEGVALARPSLPVRTLGLAAAGLLLLATSAALVAMVTILGMVESLRGQRNAIAARQRTPPPLGELAILDPAAVEEARHRRPLAAALTTEQHLAALAGRGDWDGLIASADDIQLTAPHDLAPPSQLLRARAYARLGRLAEAERTVYAIDVRRLEPGLRAEATALAGQLWLARSAPPAAPPPAEPAPRP